MADNFDMVAVLGDDYDIRVWQLNDGTWAVEGYYGDSDIDSLWTETVLPTFEDADAAVLEVIVGEE